MDSDPSTFEEFWPYYVSQHLDPVNRALHVAGTGLAISCIAASPVIPPALLAAPLVGYGLAWIGHFGFEKNKPATFGHPLWSLRGDLRMFARTLTGRMAEDLESARQQAAAAAPAVDLDQGSFSNSNAQASQA